MKQNINSRQANSDHLFMNKSLLIKKLMEKTPRLRHADKPCRCSMRSLTKIRACLKAD